MDASFSLVNSLPRSMYAQALRLPLYHAEQSARHLPGNFCPEKNLTLWP